jgi:SAM-dependent methyltransferase
MPSLLLGAGHSRAKKVWIVSAPDWTEPLITLDMGPECGADVVHDLEQRPLPFPDDYFDEIAAYDVLEHVGNQGDWRGWFDEFAEYWRILKPGGYFGIIVPIGNDAFADPGHTRFIHQNHFGMLNQNVYQVCIDDKQPITDYRWYWKKNFDLVFIEEHSGHHLAVMLRKA